MTTGSVHVLTVNVRVSGRWPYLRKHFKCQILISVMVFYSSHRLYCNIVARISMTLSRQRRAIMRPLAKVSMPFAIAK